MRSLRRHHLKRLKNKRIKRHFLYGKPIDFSLDRLKGKLGHTARLCSCSMCGNPRKFNKEKSLKEKSDLEFNKYNNIDDNYNI